MYINEYNIFVNLYNWITDSSVDTPIKVEEKSDFFSDSHSNNYKGEVYFDSINKLIGYNYLYNYIYYLQTYIKKIDSSFSLSNYNNINDLSSYIDSAQDIDLLIFMDWFLEEGVIKIADFIESLESNMYKDEDMYNIMRYYNYLIDDSIKNSSDTMLTFLTEGCTEVFSKLSEYVIKPVTYNDVMYSMNENRGIIGEENVRFSTFSDMEPQILKINNDLILTSACEMQTSFLFY